MKNSVLMRSINTLYFRQNNSLILKLTSGQRESILDKYERKNMKNNYEYFFNTYVLWNKYQKRL
jgi:hypothetical protein